MQDFVPPRKQRIVISHPVPRDLRRRNAALLLQRKTAQSGTQTLKPLKSEEIMSTLAIETLPLSELKQLRVDLDKVISMKEHREKIDAHARLVSMAKEMGFKLGELIELAAENDKPKNTRVKAIRKYRNPEDPAVTWSGRGRQPAWFSEALSNGKRPEDLYNLEAFEQEDRRRQA